MSRAYAEHPSVIQRVERRYGLPDCWTSYEVGKPLYVRAELCYRGVEYVGTGRNDEAAYADLERQLPRLEDEIEVIFWHDWLSRQWCAKIYTPVGAWRVDGLGFREALDKLLKIYKRHYRAPRQPGAQ